MEAAIRHRLIGPVEVLVFAVAAIVRLRMLLQPSPFFVGTYDDGVYFTDALNLLHGHLLYRDVLLLQPPAIVLATSPFAALAPLVGDARAFVLARIAFALVGAANAVLVAVLLRRAGAVAQVTGGLLYALSWGAVYAERTISIETFGTTGVLVGLLLLRSDDRRRRWPLLAGVAAGVAIGFKVWYVVPFVILAAAAGRRVLPFLAGGAAAGLVVYLPFFLTAPALMWRDVVTVQLGRPDQGIPVGTRIRSIIGLDAATPGRPWWQIVGAPGVAVLLGLLAVLVVLTLTTRGSRVFVALLAGCATLLLISPSYLQHYATLTAGPLALVGGAGAGRAAALLRVRGAAASVTAVVALLAVGAFLAQDLGARSQKEVPRAALEAATARIPGCLVSDDPTVLIVIGRVTPDLDRGCVLQADPSGINYTLTPPGRRQALRQQDPAFQREILHYFRSAGAYLFVRGADLGLTPGSLRSIHDDRVLYRTGRFVIRTGHD